MTHKPQEHQALIRIKRESMIEAFLANEYSSEATFFRKNSKALKPHWPQTNKTNNYTYR